MLWQISTDRLIAAPLVRGARPSLHSFGIYR